MNETETRAELIDPALLAVGWGVVEGSRVRREFPINKGRLIGHGQRNKPDKADYVLQYKNRNLAVIEAKAGNKHYTEGVGQAKDYAQKLQVRFAFSTNGLKHYRMDMHEGTEEDILSFPSPDELWQMTFAVAEIVETNDEAVVERSRNDNAWCHKLLSVPFEIRGNWEIRYYQEIAVSKVIEAVAAGKPRILLTLATGTGKTAIAF
jgi:type I restriction enzyme R subunit